jgi:hypothetical protein
VSAGGAGSSGERGASVEVGLCAGCRFARVQRGAKGGAFWRCLRADFDARFRRYPPLPVRECTGFERAEGA